MGRHRVVAVGAGNPGAWNNGQNGTGGLLVIKSNVFNNTGTISSNGSKGGTAYSCGGNAGGSGAGSINIFYNSILNRGTIIATGGSGGDYNPYDCGYGGKGGDGCITIGNISTGTFVQE